MRTPHIDRLATEWQHDPEVQKTIIKFRAGMLELAAWWNELFPPDSPTSRRRGGCKLAPSQELKDAVCAILDARTGFPVDAARYVKAVRNSDAGFFRLMAEAVEYLETIPQAHSVFAKHVIAARKIAANMIDPELPLPRWNDVKARIEDLLGPTAYLENSKDWGRVRKAAGLMDLTA